MQRVFLQNSKNFKGVLATLLFLLAAVCILGSPSASSKGAAEGLKLCSSVIIPALFPFTVVSIFFQKSGGLDWIGQKIGYLTFKIFNMSGSIFSSMLLSLIGGYPVAPKIINDLKKEGSITENEAKNALKFCVNPSPAFFIGVVGIGITKNLNIGLLLFAANTLSCFVLNIITFRRARKGINRKKSNKINTPTVTDAFVLSVSEGCSVCLNICAWVILFSSLAGLLKSILQNEKFFCFLSPFLEVTVGSMEIGNFGIDPRFFSAILAFGGLSTICQIKQFTKDVDFSFADLIIFRCIHGAVATFFSFILFKLFPQTTEVISNFVKPVFSGFPLEISSVVLALTAIVFLVYLKPIRKPDFD